MISWLGPIQKKRHYLTYSVKEPKHYPCKYTSFFICPYLKRQKA